MNKKQFLELAASRLSSDGKSLGLRWQKIGSEGMKWLSECTHLSSLQSLNLNLNEIGDEGVKWLSQSTHINSLQSLHLGGNKIGLEGMRWLSESTHITSLYDLDLGCNNIGPEGTKWLSECTHLSSLQSLDLKGNVIGDEGVKWLSQSTYLNSLHTLNLYSNDIEDITPLLTSPYLAALSNLSWDEYVKLPDTLSLTCVPWDEEAPLYHRTRVLARMCNKEPDLSIMPNFASLLVDSSHPALLLWTLKLLKTWDCGACCIDALEQLQVEDAFIGGLCKGVLSQAVGKMSVLKKEAAELERALFC